MDVDRVGIPGRVDETPELPLPKLRAQRDPVVKRHPATRVGLVVGQPTLDSVGLRGRLTGELQCDLPGLVLDDLLQVEMPWWIGLGQQDDPVLVAVDRQLRWLTCPGGSATSCTSLRRARFSSAAAMSSRNDRGRPVPDENVSTSIRATHG